MDADVVGDAGDPGFGGGLGVIEDQPACVGSSGEVSTGISNPCFEGVGAVADEGFGVGVGPGSAADGGITKEDFSGIDAEALARCQGSGEGA